MLPDIVCLRYRGGRTGNRPRGSRSEERANMNNTECFDMDRVNVARYFYLAAVLLVLVTTIGFFGAGLVLALIYAVTFGPWLSRAQAVGAKSVHGIQ